MPKEPPSPFSLIDKYRDYIAAYSSIFRLETFEPSEISEIYLKIKNVLMKKYEISIIHILESIDYACGYRDHYLEGYLQLIQFILQDVNIISFNPFRYTPNIEKLMVYMKNSQYFEFFSQYYFKAHKFNSNHSHNKGSFLNCVMNDDIEAFISFFEKDQKLQNFSCIHDLIGSLNLLEWCCYYGSQNIFTYIVSEYDPDISSKCFQLCFLGGNSTIMNELMKDNMISDSCMEYAVISHNSDFIIYLKNSGCKIYPKVCLHSSNLFALILYYEQSKNENELYIGLTHFGLNSMFEDYEFQQEMVSVKNCEGKTVLHYFAIQNNVILLQTMIDNGIDINEQDDFKYTALLYTAKYNCIDAANILLENGADVDIYDGDNFSALHVAALYNCTEIVSNLISHGLSVHVKNNYSEVPLHSAVRWNCLESVAILIENGSDVNATNLPKSTPLELAVVFNFIDAASLLIDFGADINATNQFQKLPLIFHAVTNNSILMLDLLIDNGANVNARRGDLSTPLHIAAEFNSTECAIELVQKGAEIDAKQIQGITPLGIAVCKSRETAIALIELGADVNEVGAYQIPILQTACAYSLKDIVPLLISEGANPHARDTCNSSAIHAAATANNVEAISCLLEHGVDVNLRGYDSRTPLFCAVNSGAYEATKFLLENNADVNLRYDEFTILHHAASSYANIPILNLLISHGCDINSYDGNGQVPLHIAVRYNRVNTVSYLIEKGANLNVKDLKHQTPLDIALKHNFSDIVNILVNAMQKRKE